MYDVRGYSAPLPANVDFHEFVHGKVFLRQLRIEQITHQETVSFVSLKFMIKGNKYQLFPSRPVIKCLM